MPEKLRQVRKFGEDYDVIVVHRDADGAGPEKRRDEIAQAVSGSWPGQAHVAVVPVRMLEAWLLLDELGLRQVAENPKGTMDLQLPRGAAAERMADPKAFLKKTLATASGYGGRRLTGFQKRFPQHRHKLLERLDPFGPVTELASWRAFTEELMETLTKA